MFYCFRGKWGVDGLVMKEEKMNVGEREGEGDESVREEEKAGLGA